MEIMPDCLNFNLFLTIVEDSISAVITIFVQLFWNFRLPEIQNFFVNSSVIQ